MSCVDDIVFMSMLLVLLLVFRCGVHAPLGGVLPFYDVPGIVLMVLLARVCCVSSSVVFPVRLWPLPLCLNRFVIAIASASAIRLS